MAKSNAPKLTKGIVPMMLSADLRGTYRMEIVPGFVMGQFGISKNPYNSDMWAVTYIPNGLEIKGFIPYRRDAADLMIALHEIFGDIDLTQIGDYTPLAYLIHSIIRDWNEAK